MWRFDNFELIKSQNLFTAAAANSKKEKKKVASVTVELPIYCIDLESQVELKKIQIWFLGSLILLFKSVIDRGLNPSWGRGATF